MAPLKTTCVTWAPPFNIFLILNYLFSQSFHPFHYLAVKINFFRKKNFQLESKCMHHLSVFLGNFKCTDQYKMPIMFLSGVFMVTGMATYRGG